MNKTKLLQFKSFLNSQKLSKTSVKNYLSDIRHFFAWTANNKILILDKVVLEKYKKQLIQSKKPIKTINRYLASLRKYGLFLKKEGLMQQNPAQGLQNYYTTQGQGKTQSQFIHSSSLILKFKDYLKKDKNKPATIKNYMSDVNQFLNWLEKI